MTHLGISRLRPRQPGKPQRSFPKRKERPSSCGVATAHQSSTTSSGDPESILNGGRNAQD